jgi:hypothetical protein
MAWMADWPKIRDLILFLAGLAGVSYETLGTNVDRPTLLFVFAAMMGLPVFLGKKGRNEDD